MKVSILLPVHNGAKTLKETAQSILAQTHTDLELIVVNDGSTDNSEEIIKSFSDERIKYFAQENSGSPARPRNVAAKHARGELLALCDQDDVWYPEKLERQVRAYEDWLGSWLATSNDNKKGTEEIGVIYSRADYIDENGKKIGISEAPTKEYLTPCEAHQKMLMGIFITACSVIFTKEAFDYAGGFDESLKGNDEYDIYLKITEKYGVLGLVEPLCAWRSTSTGLSSKISNMYVENEKIFKKLAKTEKDKNLLEIAHNKNINRIVVATLLEDNLERARYFAVVGAKNGNSAKGVIIAKLALFNPRLASFVVKLLKVFGMISV